MPLFKKPDTDNPESGFASIVIALVLILIMALLTVGFAQLAQREQQNALDKQLANQAYYAAESGVNDVYYAITRQNPTLTQAALTAANYNPADCLPLNLLKLISPNPTQPNNLDAPSDVNYTCVKVNLNPSNLGWTDLPPGIAKNLTTTASGALNTLTVSWNNAQPVDNNYPASTTGFPTMATWSSAHNAPVLELSLTPLPATGFSRTQLITSVYTVYLYPSTTNDCNNAPTPATGCTWFGTGSTAPILNGDCAATAPGTASEPYNCNVIITGLPVGVTNYQVHLLGFYDDANVLVSGTPVVAGGGPVTFSGQPVVDVTAEARNVLKRIQVRASNNPSLPEEALEGTICKREQTTPANTTFVNPDGTPGAGTVCDPTVNP